MLPKFIRRRIYDCLLYGWISCVRYTLPGATYEEAVKSFYKRYGLPSNEKSIAAGIKTYQRMQKEIESSEFNDD